MYSNYIQSQSFVVNAYQYSGYFQDSNIWHDTFEDQLLLLLTDYDQMIQDMSD